MHRLQTTAEARMIRGEKNVRRKEDFLIYFLGNLAEAIGEQSLCQEELLEVLPSGKGVTIADLRGRDLLEQDARGLLRLSPKAWGIINPPGEPEEWPD